jgi:NADH dehydrogenase
MLWRTVYLMKLPRFEKKLRVALQWALDMVFACDLGQYITMRDFESLKRLLETERQGEGSTGASRQAGPQRIAS